MEDYIYITEHVTVRTRKTCLHIKWFLSFFLEWRSLKIYTGTRVKDTTGHRWWERVEIRGMAWGSPRREQTVRMPQLGYRSGDAGPSVGSTPRNHTFPSTPTNTHHWLSLTVQQLSLNKIIFHTWAQLPIEKFCVTPTQQHQTDSTETDLNVFTLLHRQQNINR